MKKKSVNVLSAEGFDWLVGETTRPVFARYFNLYRIVLSSAFAIFAGVFNGFGVPHLDAFRILTLLYWIFAVAFSLLPANKKEPSTGTLIIQVTVDILTLVTLMYLSGGMFGGIPYLLMTTIVGAGLLGEGRLVMGFASMATIAVLAEKYLRVSQGEADLSDITLAGMISVGYFAVAFVSRMLAKRAHANEELALRRGADLERQRLINARIIEDMLDGIVVLDKEGIIRQCNPHAINLLGLNLKTGGKLDEYSQTLSTLSKSGAAGDAISPAFKAFNSGRNLRIRHVFVGDNGDRVLYFEDLDRMQAKAREVTLAALGRLTANIAHEIRNPLSAIVHAGDLLEGEKRADMQSRLLRIVRENAGRIERIVKDVLELGRRDRATIERLDAKIILRGFIEEFSLHTDFVSLDVAEETPFYFDRIHLHQILSNLLGNALRYCTHQADSVRVTCRRMDNGKVLIQVCDDGMGIPLKDRDKIFEPFFTSHPKGTGLGLYVARELAEANGASLVLAEQEENCGAKFYLYCRGDV